MIVIADTTPVNYLVLIQAADLLPCLFGQVLIPPAVFAELKDPGLVDVMAYLFPNSRASSVCLPRLVSDSSRALVRLPVCDRRDDMPGSTESTQHRDRVLIS